MRVKCKKCGDIVENKSRRKFWCNCGKVMIDGGNDRIKVAGGPSNILFVDDNYNELPKAAQHVIKNSRFGREGSLTAKILYVNDLETKSPIIRELESMKERIESLYSFYHGEVAYVDIENAINQRIAELRKINYLFVCRYFD